MPRILPFGKSPLNLPPKTRDVHAEQGTTSPTQLRPVRRPSVTMDLLHLNKEKRKSVAERPPSTKGSPKIVPVKTAAKIEVDVQSPPLTFYGTPEVSTGALLGGQLKLVVTDPEVKIESFTMELLCKTNATKPVSKDCAGCAAGSEELRKWDFLKEPKTLPNGTHSFPFSNLLSGDRPTSTSCKLGSITYSLHASAKTSQGDVIKVVKALEVKRALPEPQMPRTSQRIFPPTNLKTELEHPTLIHPIGQFSTLFRLTGIVWQDRHAQFRWRLRRLNWILNENIKVISKPCAKHAGKIGGEGKAVEHTDVRVIGQAEVKAGWKTDYSPSGASVEMELHMAPNPDKHPVCDVDDKKGFAVSHVLVVELIVAEEVGGAKGGTWNPTGTARVLRTQHHIIMSERAGMGIAWDEEMPPMYEDVPESPPWYPAAQEDPGADLTTTHTRSTQMLDYAGEDLPPWEEELDLRR